MTGQNVLCLVNSSSHCSTCSWEESPYFPCSSKPLKTSLQSSENRLGYLKVKKKNQKPKSHDQCNTACLRLETLYCYTGQRVSQQKESSFQGVEPTQVNVKVPWDIWSPQAGPMNRSFSTFTECWIHSQDSRSGHASWRDTLFRSFLGLSWIIQLLLTYHQWE